MCGIAGFYSPEEKNTKEISQDMAEKLGHRGPDAKGFFAFGNYSLIHTRLSIIDLSVSSNQPFASACGRYKIVFNGEVYNFKELASKYNLSLRTTGDTEVIIELFAKIGPRCVEEFNGMFAFVILDLQEEQLFLFRDRLGVKPLFYYYENETFIFGSEIKAILVFPGIKAKLKINYSAINSFLHFGFIPEAESAYEKIYKFPSGSYGILKSGKLTTHQYWNIESKIAKSTYTNEKEAADKLEELLFSSIQYRLISDVPYGTFLSGGIDSSLVTAIASKITGGNIKTFSIGFSESKYNEAVYASRIAKHLKTDHHEFILSEGKSMELLSSVIDNFDEPYADSSALPTYMVSKLSGQHVKMVLTGDGGDELFMGYGSYAWARRLNNFFVRSFRKSIYTILWHSKNNRNKRASQLFNHAVDEKLPTHIFSQEQYYFSRAEINQILNQKYVHPIVGHYDFNSSRKLFSDEKQALFDINYYLKDDLLAKVDRSSMLASIEAREPLLDYRIVEFAVNLDRNLKIKNNTSKYLLKKILYKYVPQEYFNRPKWGFALPLETWMENEFKVLINDYLSKEAVLRVGIYNPDEIEKLKERFNKGEKYLFNRLWLLTILNRWMFNVSTT